MSEEIVTEATDINSDGPELSCPYIDGVISRYPDTKTTLEYVRTINAQLRYDRDSYATINKDLQAEVELLKADRAELIEALKYVIDHSMPNTYNNKKAIKVLKKSKERLGE